jgi:1-deoxy-D-xylulose-5-phosphate reductoisomerase
VVGVPGDGTRRLNPLIVLGATGSIGRQTLDVAARLGLPVAGLAARRRSDEFFALAAAHPGASLALSDADAVGDVPSQAERRLSYGADAVAALAATPSTTVVNGIVGAEGLAPSVAAVSVGNRLALANKESLVAGGPVLLAAAARHGGAIVPVDSEHSALWQCLVGEPPDAVSRLILTASGGPFRGRRRAELATVTVAEALAHPTWAMGPRISIDSATMMNKALEVIEAHYLFGVAYNRIDVVVHPQSIVHSLVEMVDGSVKAQLGEPDMRVPIQYAITAPHRAPASITPLDLAGRSLTFDAPDGDSFPCLALGYEAGRRGGVAPAALNAADEVAVGAFLEGGLFFLDIAAVVEECLDATPDFDPETVADVLAADRDARAFAAEAIARRT